jgi:hypothetical protein
MIYNFLRTLVSYIESIFYKFFFKSSSDKIKSLKNKYLGGDVLIVANGPSLNNTNLDKLSHLPSIGLNKINLIFDRVRWRPNFIVCGNRLVAKQNASFFNSSNIPILLAIKTIWSGIAIKNQIYFYQNRNLSISDHCEFSIGSGGTVTFVALQLARYMGAKRIFIVGMDHNFNKSVTTKSFNQPKVEKFEGNDINHFDKNYFKDMKWDLPNLEYSERAYSLFNSLAKSEGIEVYDATIDGKCNIFKKIRYIRSL